MELTTFLGTALLLLAIFFAAFLYEKHANSKQLIETIAHDIVHLYHACRTEASRLQDLGIIQFDSDREKNAYTLERMAEHIRWEPNYGFDDIWVPGNSVEVPDNSLAMTQILIGMAMAQWCKVTNKRDYTNPNVATRFGEEICRVRTKRRRPD